MEKTISIKRILFRDYTTPLEIPPEQWIWWTSLVSSYQVLAQSAIPATGSHAAGISYDSFAVNPAKYLSYLSSRSKELGAKHITSEVQSFTEIFHKFENVRGVINCTGLGATKLVEDPKLFPTKGQSVIVRGLAHGITTGLGDDWETVIVPRYGTNETFLGVSKVPGDWYVHFLLSIVISWSKDCFPPLGVSMPTRVSLKLFSRDANYLPRSS
jgi:hypothetical protein